MKNISILLAAIILCLLLACPSVLAGTMSENEVSDAMVRGYTAIKANDFDSAKAIFAAVARDAPTSPRAPEAMAALGSVYYKTDDETTAMNTYRALVQNYPDTPEAGYVLYRLGSQEMRTRRFADAQQDFRAAADNKHISNLDRGRALLQIGFVDLAEYFAYQNGNNLPLLITPGDGQPILDSAKQQFQATRNLYANSVNPEIAAVADAALGEIYLLSGRPILAEEAYRRVSGEYGPIPLRLATLAQYGLGEALYGQGDLASALQRFDQALNDFSPGGEYGLGVAPIEAKADLHAWKVLTLYGLKRFDEALDAAQEGKAELEEDPALADKVPTMDLWEGNILCQMGNTGVGLTILQGIITDHPGTPQATHAAAVISQFEGGAK